MPWLYIDSKSGMTGANVTDDDANVIGILACYDLNMAMDGAQAQLEIIVTDLPGWLTGFHKSMLGS